MIRKFKDSDLLLNLQGRKKADRAADPPTTTETVTETETENTDTAGEEGNHTPTQLLLLIQLKLIFR